MDHLTRSLIEAGEFCLFKYLKSVPALVCAKLRKPILESAYIMIDP